MHRNGVINASAAASVLEILAEIEAKNCIDSKDFTLSTLDSDIEDDERKQLQQWAAMKYNVKRLIQGAAHL